MSKGTPRWYVESDGRGPYICENRQGRIATIECESFKMNGGTEDWKRAKLMAAAPDLLQALMQLMSINPLSDYNETRDAKAVAREAIAKAIGETIKP